MPAEAIKNGAVDAVLPLPDISAEIIRIVNSSNNRGRKQ
jgi:chemotaxis response regulator CheB